MLNKIHATLKDEKNQTWVKGLYLFVFVVFLLIISRIYAAIVLRQSTNAAAITKVAIIKAAAEVGVDTVVLPGNVQAWHESPIFARANGYLKNWYVDIGSRVKTGDLLAEIETPELNAQKRQAAADLKTAIANNELAQTTARRWQHLVKTESVSKQERDEKVSSAKALYAAMMAAKANLERLEELVSFERVIAPFDGVITLRTTDIGDLIDAGSSTAMRPLFRIAQTNPLRIYVKIPQYYSERIVPQMAVMLRFAEHPHRAFKAKLFQTAQAIDPNSRTLLAQFTVENKEGILLPGSYTQVHFTLPIPPKTVMLPVNTLLFRAQGLQVATVNAQNQIELKSISISRDFGAKVEVANGINLGDRVVINPPDSITNGETVRVVS